MAVVNRIIGATNRNPARKARTPSGTGVLVDITVDPFDTQRLLSMAQMATSGPNLANFLVDDAHEYFREEISMRFAYEGDRKSGHWAPLHDATVDIRRALGYPGAGPINRRTDELFDFVTTHYDITAGDRWAQLTFPGDPPTESVRAKLETAQRGSDNNPLGYGPTTPRPVLAVDESDLANVLIRLETHIIKTVVGLIDGGTS